MKVIFYNLSLSILIGICTLTGLYGQDKLNILSYNVMHGFEGDSLSDHYPLLMTIVR